MSYIIALWLVLVVVDLVRLILLMIGMEWKGIENVNRYADKPSILLKTVMNTNYKDSESKTNEIISQQADAKVEEVFGFFLYIDK